MVFFECLNRDVPPFQREGDSVNCLSQVFDPRKLLNNPVKYSRTHATIRMPPPLLGENTDEILSEYLGLTPVEIQ